MVEDVVDARDHLVVRQRHRVAGIQNGKARHDLFIGKDVTDLGLGRGVGDDRARIHLRTGTRKREHAAHGKRLAVGLLKAHEVLLPGILGAVHRHGHGLGVVAHRAAAHGKKKLRLVRTRDLDALVELLERRIGHHARNLGHVLARIGKLLLDLVVEARLLDRAAAVDQDDIGAILGKLRVKALQGVFSEVKLGRIAVSKVAEHVSNSKRLSLRAALVRRDSRKASA